MPRLSTITHDNYNTQSKVNYFADYLNTYNHLLGLDHNFEFENPLSVLNRISYQINKNPTHRHNYLPGLFKEFRKFDLFLKNYNRYEYINENIDADKINTKNECTVWVNANKNDIKELQLLLENSMFENAVNEIIVLLSCNHSLFEHKNLIELTTRIIISDLRFKDRRKEEVGVLINRITSKKPTKAILPNHLKDNEEIDIFLKNRTFKEQFEGIINFQKIEKQKEIFIFRIFDIGTDFKRTFEYNNVTFSGVKYWKIKNIKKEAGKRNNPLYNGFFEPENILLAWVEVEYVEKEVGKLKAKNTIQNALDYLNITFDFSGKLDNYKFISTVDFTRIGGGVEFKNNEIDNLDRNAINEKNPFKILKNINSVASKQFLNFEYIYQRAIISGDIIDYWQYLECICETQDQKIIYDSFSKILAYSKLNNIRIPLEDTIINILTNYGDGIGQEGYLTRNEHNIIYNNPCGAKLINIISRFDYPIIKELESYFVKSSTKDYRLNLIDYYRSIIKQLYEMRNAFIHQGFKDQENELKLQLIVPKLIEKLRELILIKIKKSRTSSLSEIINKMCKSSQTANNK